MALPNNFSNYSTLQANYDRLAGVQPQSAIKGPNNYDPIRYSQPVNSLRQGGDIINVSSDGNLSPQQQMENQTNRIAQSQASRVLGNFRAQGLINQGLEGARNAYINNYQLTPQERQNINRLTNQGYSTGFAFENRGTQFASNANQAEGRILQENYDQQNARSGAFNAATGYNYNPSSLEQSYQRLLGRF